MPLHGQGGFQAFEAPPGQAESLCERMRLGGFEMGVGFKGRLLLIPPLSGMDAAMRERLFRTLEESLHSLGHGAGA